LVDLTHTFFGWHHCEPLEHLEATRVLLRRGWVTYWHSLLLIKQSL